MDWQLTHLSYPAWKLGRNIGCGSVHNNFFHNIIILTLRSHSWSKSNWSGIAWEPVYVFNSMKSWKMWCYCLTTFPERFLNLCRKAVLRPSILSPFTSFHENNRGQPHSALNTTLCVSSTLRIPQKFYPADQNQFLSVTALPFLSFISVRWDWRGGGTRRLWPSCRHHFRFESY